jgi:uncharacterized integral membrane protein
MYEQPEGGADLHPEERRRPTATLIILVVIAAAAITFVVQNSDKATIHFLFFSVTARIWIGFLTAIVLGIVLDRLFTMWWKRRKQQQQ